jgi:hypothetical protein
LLIWEFSSVWARHAVLIEVNADGDF